MPEPNCKIREVIFSKGWGVKIVNSQSINEQKLIVE